MPSFSSIVAQIGNDIASGIESIITKIYNDLKADGLICYASGSLIRTAQGDVPVESLQIGDELVTSSGALRPIRWIGHRTVECSRYDQPRLYWPVRIAANAFGAGKPSRDLFVSPAHAVCVPVLDEVLVPASSLINGANVEQVEIESVTYWHVELDSHDVIIANNLPAESYLDVGNRGFFVESETVDMNASPDGVRHTTADFCRPFLTQGAVVDAVRSRLRDRALAAGWTIDEEPLGNVHVLADGVLIVPQTDGLTARFLVPADAKDVRLVSDTTVPATIVDSADQRILGVCLKNVSIDDGLTGKRDVRLDDETLGHGLYDVEFAGATATRWTNGHVRLPATLWDGCRGHFFLRVELAGSAVPRWVAPERAVEHVPLATCA